MRIIDSESRNEQGTPSQHLSDAVVLGQPNDSGGNENMALFEFLLRVYLWR